MAKALPAFALATSAIAGDFPIMAGLNIPWDNFGYDIGGDSFAADWFESYFADAQSNGQNIARFWVHTDGARAGLEYNGDGTIKGLSSTYNDHLQQLLGLAQNHKVVVQLCLWSFDMCKDETSQGSTKASIISNKAITQSYIDNALTPRLEAVSQYPNLIIETINEPEWCMKGPGNTPDLVDAVDMQRFVAMIAEASHAAGRKVTTGSASLKWSSFASESEASYWHDAALQAAYPSASGTTGTMDFYNVHYYDWMYNDDWGYDPMRADIAHWKLDKPTAVAEIPPSSDHYTVQQLLDVSTANGFKGLLFWAYNDPDFDITPAIAPLKSYAQSQGASYDALLSWMAAPTPPPTPPPCDDVGPDQNSCEDQQSWGKCSESWMKGYCCKTCWQCDAACGNSDLIV
jgi:hypothetical protein